MAAEELDDPAEDVAGLVGLPLMRLLCGGVERPDVGQQLSVLGAQRFGG
jgi:hypothetical protein